jgi:hypothetical protein
MSTDENSASESDETRSDDDVQGQGTPNSASAFSAHRVPYLCACGCDSEEEVKFPMSVTMKPSSAVILGFRRRTASAPMRVQCYVH